MKAVRKFTRDSLVRRPCNCAKCVAKRNPTTDAVRTEDRVDLNEIHRRFWARIAGKK